MHRREECRRAVSLDQIQNNGDTTLRVGRHLNLHLGISLPIPLSTAEPPHSSMMTVETVPDTEGSPKMASLPQSEQRGQLADASRSGGCPRFRSTCLTPIHDPKNGECPRCWHMDRFKGGRSLHPLSFDEAIKALMKVNPKAQKKQAKAQKGKSVFSSGL